MKTKVCTKCDIEKPLDQFNKAHHRCSLGVTYYCKVCISAYYKEYRKLNKDKILDNKRRYFASNKERCREYYKSWYKRNPDDAQDKNFKRYYGSLWEIGKAKSVLKKLCKEGESNEKKRKTAA